MHIVVSVINIEGFAGLIATPQIRYFKVQQQQQVCSILLYTLHLRLVRFQFCRFSPLLFGEEWIYNQEDLKIPHSLRTASDAECASIKKSWRTISESGKVRSLVFEGPKLTTLSTRISIRLVIGSIRGQIARN